MEQIEEDFCAFNRQKKIFSDSKYPKYHPEAPEVFVALFKKKRKKKQLAFYQTCESDTAG